MPGITKLSRLLFTLFCFSFTSPAFAFSPISNLEELIYAAIGSAIVSLIAMVVVLVKLKISLLPRLLAMLVAPVLVFPLCMAGSMGMGYIAHEIKQYQQEQDAAHIARVEEDAWQHNFLRINACEGNHALLQSELASGRHQIESKLRALNECVLPQADAQALRILLQDAVSNDKEERTYCTYLPPVLQSMNTVLLDVFVEQKLSLACPSPKYDYVPDTSKVAPAWWDILNDEQITSDTKDKDRLLTILRYLQAHNVDMKVVADDRSLLTIAMESGKVDLILFALDAGVDPYALPENDNMLSPQQIWTLQRFGYADAGSVAYKEADQKRIQSHLREMSDTASRPSSATAPEPAPRYDPLTVAAVIRFQQRHGLRTDGVIDAETVTQLEVPMRVRLASIELALERARWIPAFGDAPSIHVNLPSFSLRAINSLAEDGNLNEVESRVVIGRSDASPTPVYSGEIARIEFNPYWFVPSTIARLEIVPKLRRNPDWMVRQGMEITLAGRTHARATPALIDALAAGRASIRQRPGPRNALGQIKFVLPNARNIYLHDTSARSLFDKLQRDFSHGCVRVEKPVELARVILAGDPAWTAERITRVLERGRTVVARPAQPVKVAFTYQTVVVGANGRPAFLPDVYGHDTVATNAVARWATKVSGEVSETARGQDGLPGLAAASAS